MHARVATFQFYDSPIKSLASSSTNANTFAFQFYDSPIKSIREWLKYLIYTKFQFYDSPIKRPPGMAKGLRNAGVSIL